MEHLSNHQHHILRAGFTVEISIMMKFEPRKRHTFSSKFTNKNGFDVEETKTSVNILSFIQIYHMWVMLMDVLKRLPASN
jgi:hypothetical protein